MALYAMFAGVLAQTCVAMLPPARAEIEWFRDGRPYARDVPVRATRTERFYRREPRSGAAQQRTLSCSTSGGTTFLTERTGSVTVRLPVPLAVGASARVGTTTVRRIAPPADAGDNAHWYTVSSPGIRVYALRAGEGLIEVRAPAAGGDFSILRAVVREPAPDPPPEPVEPAASPAPDSQRLALEARVRELTLANVLLRDSMTALLRALAAPPVPWSPEDVVEFIAVDVYVERGEYDEALALLTFVRRRLDEWSERNRTRHRALDAVDARLAAVLRTCAAARAASPAAARPQQCRIDGGAS